MSPLVAAVVSALAGTALVFVLALLLRPLSSTYRGQKRRLGSAREVRRFRRAWGSGTVPADADRWLWTAELDHWPAVDQRARALRRLALCAGVIIATLLAIGVAAGDGDPRTVVATVLPVVVLVALFAAMLRFLPDPTPHIERRTQRLRSVLQHRPPTS
ncbi:MULTISPECIES: hypothetical protein [unclassified Aeromicrobium]|uniref:hypothetical protein n=1 Tax=unclassified Aeromicrobium TaxID=2633570 RepID=UPI00288AA298|nr:MULTISPECIES: hypothetical protein [unclassified Aeromicrobium]